MTRVIIKNFASWKDCYIKDNLAHKLSAVALDEFKKAEFIPDVVEKDRNQSEFVLYFGKYYSNVRKRVSGGDFGAFYE